MIHCVYLMLLRNNSFQFLFDETLGTDFFKQFIDLGTKEKTAGYKFGNQAFSRERWKSFQRNIEEKPKK